MESCRNRQDARIEGPSIRKVLLKLLQGSYALCLVVQGILQFYYRSFRPVLLPEWPAQIPGGAVCARIAGAALIAAGAAILFDKRAREVALLVGGTFLVSALFWQLPYALFVLPHTLNPFSWGGPFNALSLAGCSFVVAASFPATEGCAESFVFRFLEKLVPAGGLFLSLMLIRFGIGHYLHTTHDAALIPAWIPWHTFWTYFTGAALIGSGLAIVTRIQVRPIATLLGTMIFLWVVTLHIPRAIADPYVGQGNEIESAARALAESATAFLIACSVQKPRKAAKI